MQLNPFEEFVIFRQLGDHTDSNTYYVRAVIKNAKTKAVIDTVDLTDNGSGNFSVTWQVVADPSGEGLYVEIITSVYTDSGYTTKSSLYPDHGKLYLIHKRWDMSLMGGGGAKIDYSRINKDLEKIVKKQLKKLPKPKEFKINLEPVIKSAERAEKAIKAVRIPDQEEIDLSPVLSEIEGFRRIVLTAIKNIPEPEEIDLSPILKRIENLKIEEANEKLDKILNKIKSFFEIDINTIKSLVKSIHLRLDKIPKISEAFKHLIKEATGSEVNSKEAKQKTTLFKRHYEKK